MRLRSLLVVIGLAAVPAFAMVETVDIPAAHAMNFTALETQIGRLNEAISKLKELAAQPAPAKMTKAQIETWNAQSKLTNEVLAQLHDWHEKLTDCLKRGKNKEPAKSDDEKLLINFQNARQQMMLHFKTFSPNTPAGKTRLDAAQQALGSISS